MVPVAPDMKVDTQSPTTKRMQEGVLELLLANHPLDCPVCDKGGECPLQDQAFSHGPGESRYVEEKRHYEKPIAISDIVYLDRERCILCDRCTRFADEVAGDALIHFISRGNNTTGQHLPRRAVRSYFSGNTVQICPVGALTAKPYRFKARPWDLEQESTCTTCSVGCRTVVQSSRDQVLRYQGVDSDPVNWGWLCDRGRFNFEAVNSASRAWRAAGPHRDGRSPPPGTRRWPQAACADHLAKAAAGGVAEHRRHRRRPWHQRGRVRLGPPRTRSSAPPTCTRSSATACPSACSACREPPSTTPRRPTTIVLLGPDLKEELPVLYLRLRDAARSSAAASSSSPQADRPHALRVAQHRLRAGHAGRGRREGARRPAPSPRSSQGQRRRSSPVAPTSPSRRPPPSPRCRHCSPPSPAPRCCRRSVAATWSARSRWACAPARAASTRRGALQAAADGKIECLVLLGADPLADFPDTDLARRALAGARRIIAVDTFLVHVVEAGRRGAGRQRVREKAGTTTNLEGRVSTVARRSPPAGTTPPRLDDRRRARPRLGTTSATAASRRSPPTSPPRWRGSPRSPPQALARTRTACSPVPAVASTRSTSVEVDVPSATLRLPPRRQPHDVRPGGRHGHVAVARTPRPGRPCTCTRSTSSGSAPRPAPR
jgi:NADH-quinone oxidoreductase subunit G